MNVLMPFLAVVKKELSSVARDSTIIIAILIQLFIASFSSAMLLGVLSLYDADTIMEFSGNNIKIGLVGPADSPFGQIMRQGGLKVSPYTTLELAEADFYKNKVSAIVVIPAGITTTAEIKLYLPDSDAVSSVIRMVLQSPLKQYENYLRGKNGIVVRYADLKGKPSTSFEFVYSVLLPMLMFFPAFVAGSMSIDSLTEEVENNTLQTLLSAPLTINGMIAAKITAAVLISAMQCAAWLALLMLNGISIQNFGWIFLLAVIIAGITSTTAALGAVLLKDRERSQFIYSLALLAAASLSTLLDISPIKTISRLGIGDFYTNGWHVAFFAAVLAALFLLLLKTSRRLTV
ncbi:MAG: ABC transporter permease [Chloroflexi bacterium]|nr:MAG: ABC transporter permease [Chloroflexota bacterium]